ncbi:hypothetical protein A2U01_0118868, partial [Trifolium medium]|nr:hypothetical protein [Trifolium medium]
AEKHKSSMVMLQPLNGGKIESTVTSMELMMSYGILWKKE